MLVMITFHKCLLTIVHTTMVTKYVSQGHCHDITLARAQRPRSPPWQAPGVCICIHTCICICIYIFICFCICISLARARLEHNAQEVHPGRHPAFVFHTCICVCICTRIFICICISTSLASARHNAQEVHPGRHPVEPIICAHV